MIPDRLQYFLEHFWSDQKCDQIWTLGPVSINGLFGLFMAYLWLTYGLCMDLLTYLWLINIIFG